MKHYIEWVHCSLGAAPGKIHQINDHCVAEEWESEKMSVLVHLGPHHEEATVRLKSAKSCFMACACDRDLLGGCKTEKRDVTCYPGWVWNRATCQCELMKQKTTHGKSLCIGRSTADNVNDNTYISIHLLVFSLILELVVFTSVAYCVTNRSRCRTRTTDISRQVSLVSRQISRQLSVPVGGVARQLSTPLMEDTPDFGGCHFDEGGGFTGCSVK